MLFYICLLTAFAPASAADARVVFSASTPDADGLFTVSVTAYNAIFEGIEFAVEYDGAVVSPASWTSGEPTANASECVKKEAAAEAISVFGSISEEKGRLIVLGYSEDDPDFSVTAGADGVKVFSIRFKVVGQGASGLCVSEEKESGGLANDYKMIPTTFVFELPAALNGGTAPSSDTTEPAMTKAERAKDTLILQIGNYAAAKDGALCHIYPGEKQITPYIMADENGNGRTMVPVRFVAEQLGATVGWDNGTQTVTIGMDGNTVKMKIGSSAYTVNGAEKTMDAAAEILPVGDGSGNGRTMVPLRFVAEALGKSVYWDQDNQLVIITGKDLPWQADRDAEKELTGDVLLMISPLLRDTVQ